VSSCVCVGGGGRGDEGARDGCVGGPRGGQTKQGPRDGEVVWVSVGAKEVRRRGAG